MKYAIYERRKEKKDWGILQGHGREFANPAEQNQKVVERPSKYVKTHCRMEETCI